MGEFLGEVNGSGVIIYHVSISMLQSIRDHGFGLIFVPEHVKQDVSTLPIPLSLSSAYTFAWQQIE